MGRSVDFKIEMPVVHANTSAKDDLPCFTPILVLDTEVDERTTVLINRDKKSVIWFDEDGYIGESDLEYFNESRHVVIRQYGPGDALVIRAVE
jgi:hypothetical protein